MHMYIIHTLYIHPLSTNVYVYIHDMFILQFNAGTPAAAPVNIRFPPDDITIESFVIQWDAMMDFFDVNYTVRWYRGDNEIGMASVDGLSYTVTGLTANTSYNVTVVAINTCCGAGPVSNVVMIMTNMRPPTLPPPTTTTTPVPSSTPPPGNLHTY